MRKIVVLFVLLAALAGMAEGKTFEVKLAAFLYLENQPPKLIFIDVENNVGCAYQEYEDFLGQRLGKANAKIVLIMKNEGYLGRFKHVLANPEGDEVRVITDKGLILSTKDGFSWEIDGKSMQLYRDLLKSRIDPEKVKVGREKDKTVVK